MARVAFAVGAGASDDMSDVVDATFFGGNFLFDRDRVGEDGTWDEKAEALNLGLIRYPGGTITERFFDLTDPDRALIDGAHGGDALGLSDFLAHAGETGAPVALVLPTIRYMDALRGGAMTEADVRAELAAFLGALDAGAFGDAAGLALIEIGNEFYDRSVNPEGTAAEYGALARIFAEEIRGVFGARVDIAVQAGQTAAQNADVIAGFGAADALVDTVIVHDYPWDLAQARDHQALKSALVDAWTDGGLAESVFLSEWSVSNQYRNADGARIGSDRIEDGMARAVATLDIAGAYIAAGVDYAAVWPIQQNTRGDLAGDEGQTAETDPGKLSDNGLTLVGESFRLMSEVLPGTQRVMFDGAIDLDGAAEDARYRDEVLIQAYDSPDRLILFVSAWDLEDAQLGTEVALTPQGWFGGYELTTLTADGDDRDPNADPVLTVGEGLSFGGKIVLRFDNAYEIQRVVLERATPPITMIGGGAPESEDKTQADAFVFAPIGVSPAAPAGGGKTLLRGAPGGDDAAGLRDGVVETGGDGADIFVFSEGIGAMTVLGFAPGVDLIEVTAAESFADLSIVKTAGGALIALGDDSMVLDGLSPSELSADDFIF